MMLGVPLTDLHHISAFMQVSSVEPSAISAYTGTRNWEQAVSPISGYMGTG